MTYFCNNCDDQMQYKTTGEDACSLFCDLCRVSVCIIPSKMDVYYVCIYLFDCSITSWPNSDSNRLAIYPNHNPVYGVRRFNIILKPDIENDVVKIKEMMTKLNMIMLFQ